MVAFVKTPVGNKRFVIEWFLEVNMNEVSGDAFEIADCKLLSISYRRTTASGTVALCKLYHTNQSDGVTNPGVASSYITNLSTIAEAVLVPFSTQSQTPLPPLTRWIFPRLEGNSGVGDARIAMLFEEV